MIETNKEQLSAMMDGELAEAEYDLVMRRMIKDRSLCEHWERYHLASTCLRHDLAPAVDLGLAERVAAALEAEDVNALALRERPSRNWYRPAAGIAVAASVAAIALLVFDADLPNAGAGNPAVIANPVDGSGYQEIDYSVSDTSPPTVVSSDGSTWMGDLIYVHGVHGGQVPGSLFGDTRMVAYEAPH